MDDKQFLFLKEKSIDAFLLALEIFNKPTIKYRVEGMLFFLCNAWELMLKAKMLRDGKDIFYPEKDNRRSLTLSDCIKKVMTNENDPVRQNLEEVVGLRNQSTHYFIHEEENMYVPLLSFNVQAFSDRIKKYLDVIISSYVNTSFLTLFSNDAIPDENEILDKYGEGIRDMFLKHRAHFNHIYNDRDEKTSIATAIKIKVVRVSKQNLADFSFYQSRNPEDDNIQYIERTEDVNAKYPLSHHMLADRIDQIIQEEQIAYTPLSDKPSKKGKGHVFTIYALNLLLKEFNLKSNKEYVFTVNVGQKGQSSYRYSENLVQFLISKIRNDKDIVLKIHRNRKRPTPGARASHS